MSVSKTTHQPQGTCENNAICENTGVHCPINAVNLRTFCLPSHLHYHALSKGLLLTEREMLQQNTSRQQFKIEICMFTNTFNGGLRKNLTVLSAKS